MRFKGAFTFVRGKDGINGFYNICQHRMPARASGKRIHGQFFLYLSWLEVWSEGGHRCPDRDDLKETLEHVSQ